MGDSKNTSHTIFTATSINTQSKIKTRGVMMCIKVRKAYENGVHSPVEFYLRIKKAYRENVDDFERYVVLQGRSKVRILIDNWHEVDGDLKDNIWIDIMVYIMNFLFILQVYMTI